MSGECISRRSVLAALAAVGPAAYGDADAQPLVSGTTKIGAQTLEPRWEPAALGEQVWLEWRCDDLAPGPVEAWVDRAAGVVARQDDPQHRPVKTATGDVLFEGGARSLVIPAQSRGFLAHRAVVMIFRIDIASARHDEGSLFYLNGIDGALTSRQPAVLYGRSTASREVQTQWRDGAGTHAAAHPISNDFAQWHCLVTRRHNGRHYASLDGRPEVEVGSDICLLRSTKQATGLIGDHREAGVRWALDSVLVLQDQLSKDDAERLMGWALWRKAAQDRLPAAHPYRHEPPQMSNAPPARQFKESSAEEWAAIKAYWDKTDISRELEQAYLSPLDLAGYRMVFEDHFTAFSISDETSGKGPWWSPVHDAATGKARTARLKDTPPTFVQSGSELTIRMQQTSQGWTSGVFTSVNLNGHGNTWKYGYFEFRARASRGNGYAAWPAFWVKSVNEFFRLTESRLEIDLYEGYNSDPKGHHQAYHNWPAIRMMKGRTAKHRHLSNYTGIKSPQWGVPGTDLFDDRYHLYGMLIDRDWIRFYFDSKELSRFPTPLEANQELFILVDLAMLPKEADKASGIYELTLDYVRVYQA